MNWKLQFLSHNLVFQFVQSHLELRTNSIAKHASQNLGFFSRASRVSSSSRLLTLYKSQIRPSLEHCSRVWGCTSQSTRCLLDKVQSIAIRLINNLNLTNSLQPLSFSFGCKFSMFYRCLHEHCPLETRNILSHPLRRFRDTRSSTHSHPFQVSLPNSRTPSHKNYHSPKEHAIY